MVMYEPFILELTACREPGMLYVRWSGGFPLIIIEIDCQAIVTAWKQENDRSVGGQLCKEMRTYLHNFQGFDLRWTGREANIVAHLCAKEAIVLESVALSFYVISEFLIDVLQSDGG